MPRRSVETVLMELERAVEPSQGFTDALFVQLVAELERPASDELSIGRNIPIRQGMWQRTLDFLRTRRAAVGLAVLVALAVLATNLLPQTQTTAFAIVQEARASIDSLPAFDAVVIRRVSGAAIAEETRSGELPDLEVTSRITYLDADHWRVDVINNSYDSDTRLPQIAEATGSYTVADGDYVASYSKRDDVFTAMPIDDFRGPEPIGFIDPALTSFDLTDEEVREDCEPLPDRVLVGRVAHGITCEDREMTGVDNEVWFDIETGLVLSIDARPEPEAQLPPGEGGGHYIEVMSLTTGGGFKDERFETEPPPGAAVLWQGQDETPEVFRQVSETALEIRVEGQGGNILLTEAGIWAQSVKGGRGPELTEGIGRLVLIDPSSGDVLNEALLDPLHDEQPGRWIGPLATVDSVVQVGNQLWVNVNDAGSTERSKLERFDVHTGNTSGRPVLIDGDAVSLAPDGDSLWVSVAGTRPKIIGSLHTQYGDVLRLDAGTGEIADVVRPRGGPIGESAIVASGYLWTPWLVTDGADVFTSETVLLRVDTATLHPEFISLGVPGAYSTWIDGNDEMLWAVTNAGERRGALLRIDPDSGVVADRRRLDFGAIGVSVGAGRVWTLDMRNSRLLAFDLDTLDQVGPPIRVPAQPNGLDASENAVWVNSHQDGVVSRVTWRD